MNENRRFILSFLHTSCRKISYNFLYLFFGFGNISKSFVTTSHLVIQIRSRQLYPCTWTSFFTLRWKISWRSEKSARGSSWRFLKNRTGGSWYNFNIGRVNWNNLSSSEIWLMNNIDMEYILVFLQNYLISANMTFIRLPTHNLKIKVRVVAL